MWCCHRSQLIINCCGLLFAGFIVGDLPFGYNMGGWDSKAGIISSDELKRVLESVLAMHARSKRLFIALCVAFEHISPTMAVLTELDFNNVTLVTVVKHSQNKAGPIVMTKNQDLWVTATIFDDSKSYKGLPKDPTKRYTTFHIEKHPNFPHNSTAKDAGPLRRLLKWHCEPGSSGIVLCGGSGQDVVAALTAGMSCVYVWENDKEQIQPLIDRFTDFDYEQASWTQTSMDDFEAKEKIKNRLYQEWLEQQAPSKRQPPPAASSSGSSSSSSSGA